MKFPRIIPLLALFATTSLFANEVAQVTRLDGSARGVVEGDRIPLKAFSSLEDNTLIEVDSGATLALKCTRREALYVEGPARFRIHAAKDDASPAGVDLFLGKIHCNCNHGMLNVRTAVGVASQATGTIGSFDYTPALTSGTLVVYAIEGDTPVSSNGLDTVISAGKMGVFGRNGFRETDVIGPATFLKIQQHAKGVFEDAPAPASPRLPDLSIRFPRRPGLLSPNGEGSLR